MKNLDAKDIFSFPISSKNTEEDKRLRSLDGRRRLQSMPLKPLQIFQGNGAYYFDLYIGSPPQRQTVLLDTGSENVAIPCQECNDCGDNHIDPLFDQYASESFRQLKCLECQHGKCSEKDDTCRVESHYIEGSSWKGIEVNDKIFNSRSGEVPIDTNSIDKDEGVSDSDGFPLTFTCMASVEREFHDQIADGIAGLGMQGGSLWRQMYDQGYIQSKQFSLCLSSHPLQNRLVGALTLGGIDERLGQKESDMAYMEMKNSSGQYEVQIRNIFLKKNGGQRMRDLSLDARSTNTITLSSEEEILNHEGVILDSGTTGTLLTPALKEALDSAWQEATGETFPTDLVSMSANDLKDWPTFVFQMKGSPSNARRRKNDNLLASTYNLHDNPNDVLVALPPSQYMSLDMSTGKYFPLLKADGAYNKGTILGSNFMRQHSVLFDIENKRIGFAESDCNFNTILSSEGKEDQMMFPDPYVSYNKVMAWYHEDLCAKDLRLCASLRRNALVLVNASLSLILIRMLFIIRSGKRAQKKDGDSHIRTQIELYS